MYKAGLFLRHKNSGGVHKLKWDQYILDLDIWEVWKPREGDWCYFSNNGSSVVLCKFDRMCNGLFMSKDFQLYENCSPWTNEFPFELIDIK